MHLNDNLLRASLDGELTAPQQTHLDEHLAICPRCRQRLEEISQRTARVQQRLAILAPTHKPLAASHAFQRLKHKEQMTMQKTPFFRIPRLVWATFTLVAVMAGALSIPPVRALASNLLGLFRVQNIQVMPISIGTQNDMRFEKTTSEAMSALFADSVNVTRPHSDPQKAADAAEASQLAGFTVRTAQGQPPAQFIVQSGTAFEMTINAEKAQAVLDSLGRSDLKIPAELDNVLAAVDIPTGVTVAYGTCNIRLESVEEHSGCATPDDGEEGTCTVEKVKPSAEGVRSDCLINMQLPSPTLTTTPEVDPAMLAEIGLQVLGKTPEEAAALSQQIDWSSTLVIPVPMGEIDYEAVTVDGVTATLLRQAQTEEETIVPAFSLVWVKDGILYAITGTGDAQRAIDLANSLQ